MEKCRRCGVIPHTIVADDNRIVPRYYCGTCFYDEREQREKEEQKEFYIKVWIYGIILFVIIMYIAIPSSNHNKQEGKVINGHNYAWRTCKHKAPIQ